MMPRRVLVILGVALVVIALALMGFRTAQPATYALVWTTSTPSGFVLHQSVGGHHTTHTIDGINAPYYYYMVASPDGAWLAFSSRSGVYKMRPDASNLRQLARIRQGIMINQVVGWSPDGRTVLVMAYYPASGKTLPPRFSTDHQDNPQPQGVYVLGADGSEPRQLVVYESWFQPPAWSPDGQWVYYTGPTGIQRVRDDGSERQIIYPSTFYFDQPALPSPDGAWLAFFDEHGTLILLRLDDKETIDTGIRGAVGLAWSPQGGQLAYSADGQVWLYPVGGVPLPLAQLGAPTDRVQWSPDGKHLIWTVMDSSWMRWVTYQLQVESGALTSTDNTGDDVLVVPYEPTHPWHPAPLIGGGLGVMLMGIGRGRRRR